MNIQVVFEKYRTRMCDKCGEVIDVESLMVIESKVTVPKYYHYLCFREVAIAEFMEVHSDIEPRERWGITLISGFPAFASETDDSKLFCPTLDAWFEFENGAWRQVLLT